MTETSRSELAQKVAGWLGQQGYPLEMRTLQALLANGISTQPSWYYTDVESGQQRETDLLVSVRSTAEGRDPASVSLHAAIECKSGDKPWVVLTSSQSSLGVTSRRAQRFHTFDRHVFSELARDADLVAPLLDGYRPQGYAFVRALGSSNHDPVHGAILAAVKAVAGVQYWLRQASELTEYAPTRSLILPIVVVDAPLFSGALDSAGELAITEVQSATVLWRYQLSPKHPVSSIVTIVTPEHLGRLADDMKLTVDGLREAMLRRLAGNASGE